MALRWLTLIVGVLTVTACQAFDEEDIPPASLRGTLSLGEGMQAPELDDVRLSILWDNFDFARSTPGPSVCGGATSFGTRNEPLVIEQPLELELDPDFPAAFSVKAIARPPRAALGPAVDDENVATAYGNLIVYSDSNGNGRLDLRGFDGESPDIVLSSSDGNLPSSEDHGTRYHIVYLSHHIDKDREFAHQGVVPFQRGTGEAGYSLILEHTDLEQSLLVNEAKPLDASTPIELSLSATPYVQHSACSESCDIREQSLMCPADPAQLLLGDLGEPRASTGTMANAAWERVDGDRTITTTTRCERGEDDDAGENAGRELFLFGRLTEQGCTRTFEGCHYERSELPDGIDLPCTQYQTVVLDSPPH